MTFNQHRTIRPEPGGERRYVWVRAHGRYLLWDRHLKTIVARQERKL